MNEMRVVVQSIVIHDRKALLIQRSSYARSGENDWEIPGGGLAFGEGLLEGLRREVNEETGLSVRVDRLLYAMTTLVSPQRQVVALTYLSYADSGAVTLSHEHTDYVWATRKQLMELLNPRMLKHFREHSVLDMLDID